MQDISRGGGREGVLSGPGRDKPVGGKKKLSIGGLQLTLFTDFMNGGIG